MVPVLSTANDSVLGLTEAVLCVLIVSITMHAIIKTSNALIKKKKRTEKQKRRFK
jgi:hypothetical protein